MIEWWMILLSGVGAVVFYFVGLMKFDLTAMFTSLGFLIAFLLLGVIKLTS